MIKKEIEELLLKAIKLKEILDLEISSTNNKNYDSSAYISEEDLPDEIWAPEENKNWKYYLSNFGRVRYKSHRGLIIPQRKENGDLYLDKEKWEEKCLENVDTIGACVKVYPLIAEAFKIKKDGYDIHHINCNGYDNRLDNLISLPNWIHAHLAE